MTTSWLLGVMVIAALTATSGPDPQAQAKPAATEAPTGAIRGRITTADTGKPLRRVQVRAMPDDRTGFVRPVTANTNVRGEFEVKGLPPGSYLVTAIRAGYITTQYGQRRPEERGLAIAVSDGQIVERIDLAVPRAGILAGRITDELGEPYPGVRVDALTTRYLRGKRQPSPAAGATTDDLGNFRISGLQPGSYYVVATSTETWRNEKKETIGFASTYYPGGPLDQAQLVTIAPSEQKGDLHFSLHSSRAVRISGRVVREGGEPAPGAGVGIAYSYPGVIMSAGMRSVRSAADGSFQIKDVPGGVYSVSSGGDEVILTVGGSDIDDVVLTQRVGSTVSGTVLSEEGTPPPFPTSGVRVFIEAPNDKVLPTVRVVQVGQDWSFKMQNLGGPFLFRMVGLPDGWTMASAMLNDTNVADTPLDVPTGGKEIAGLKIVLTRRIGRVTGTVLDGNGRAASGAAVVIFAEDESMWMPYSRFIRATRPGSDGRFSVSHLPPGTYHAVARDFVEEGQWEDPAFLEEIRDRASRFTLTEGATATLTLKLPPK
ncbi:MAG TPA: carboxypeptidase-like regulatory domain-containing protein [Vicinamibacterales bacterium]|nr:carboxypeptidase-like regulatory domain-containing protein [Vicinamibacterales bacterium]